MMEDFYTIYNLKNNLSLKLSGTDLNKNINLVLRLDLKKLYFLHGKYSFDALN
jgi:hypothetical protein